MPFEALFLDALSALSGIIFSAALSDPKGQITDSRFNFNFYNILDSYYMLKEASENAYTQSSLCLLL